MISVKEAKKLIQKGSFHLEKESIPLKDGLGRILAADVVSSIPHPYFDQSAVDGYGVCCKILVSNKLSFSIKAEVKAGDSCGITLKPGEAIRIFTGAQVPESVDAVVMQEVVEKNGHSILIGKEHIKEGSHIRKKGEQLQANELALKKGTMITHAGIGFLASLGISNLMVHKTPKVGIIVTGNEFAITPDDLEKGKIYESNGQMLVASLAGMGIKTSYHTCKDNKLALTKMIEQEAADTDVLLITGGVSVGDYDYTVPVLDKLGYRTVFHKIRQKPGKPMYFGKSQDKAAFGLPGNPRSVMVCFYEYVIPYLNLLMNNSNPWLDSISLPLESSYKRKEDGKVHFLSADIKNNKIRLLDKQASHMLQTLALAHGIVVLEESELKKTQGDLVHVHLIPQ